MSAQAKSKWPPPRVRSRLEISAYWVLSIQIRNNLLPVEELENRMKWYTVQASPWFKLKLVELRSLNNKRLT